MHIGIGCGLSALSWTKWTDKRGSLGHLLFVDAQQLFGSRSTRSITVNYPALPDFYVIPQRKRLTLFGLRGINDQKCTLCTNQLCLKAT